MTGQKGIETQLMGAGLGRASGSSQPGARAPAPTYSDGQSRGDRQSTTAVGEGPTRDDPPSREHASVPHQFTHPGRDAGARAAIVATEPSQLAPRATSFTNTAGHGESVTHGLVAGRESEANFASSPRRSTPRSQPLAGPAREGAPGAGGEGRAVQHAEPIELPPAPRINSDGPSSADPQPASAVGEEGGGCEAAPDLRFSDPLVQEIVETWRLRQDFLRAHTKLTLQIKAICRRLCAGDKAEADRVYASMLKDRDHPLAETAWLATMPLVAAREPIEDGRKRLEKQLAKLAQRLPTAPFAAETRGFGFASLAATYGECGDVAAYRTVSGLWKRAGLAVIDGERQRKVAGDAALLHGYSPARRSVFWNIAALQVKTNGAYRPLYDARKQYRLDQGWPKGHAHNEAGRYITKRLLRDLWIAAREARS